MTPQEEYKTLMAKLIAIIDVMCNWPESTILLSCAGKEITLKQARRLVELHKSLP